MGAILRFVVGLVLAVTAVPACLHLLVRTVQSQRTWASEDPLALAIGLCLGLLWLLWRTPNRFWHTWLHELAHAAACILLRVRLLGFKATDGRGGEVEHAACDPLRTTLIAIAPYSLPLLLVPALLTQWALPPGTAREIASAACGLLLVNHFQGLWLNLSLNFFGADSDLARTGRLLGLVLIAAALLLLMAWWIQVLWTSRFLPWHG
jgi:hypothetical protein